jgi:hypothetical protein
MGGYHWTYLGRTAGAVLHRLCPTPEMVPLLRAGGWYGHPGATPSHGQSRWWLSPRLGRQQGPRPASLSSLQNPLPDPQILRYTRRSLHEFLLMPHSSPRLRVCSPRMAQSPSRSRAELALQVWRRNHSLQQALKRVPLAIHAKAVLLIDQSLPPRPYLPLSIALENQSC